MASSKVSYIMVRSEGSLQKTAEVFSSLFALPVDFLLKEQLFYLEVMERSRYRCLHLKPHGANSDSFYDFFDTSFLKLSLQQADKNNTVLLCPECFSILDPVLFSVSKAFNLFRMFNALNTAQGLLSAKAKLADVCLFSFVDFLSDGIIALLNGSNLILHNKKLKSQFSTDAFYYPLVGLISDTRAALESLHQEVFEKARSKDYFNTLLHLFNGQNTTGGFTLIKADPFAVSDFLIDAQDHASYNDIPLLSVETVYSSLFYLQELVRSNQCSKVAPKDTFLFPSLVFKASPRASFLPEESISLSALPSENVVEVMFSLIETNASLKDAYDAAKRVV